jgi:superfamily II DNA or RNA helicase
MKKIKLYDYQEEMVEDIVKVLSAPSTTTYYISKKKKVRAGSSVMVQMPTGTGKTYVMAAVVKWFLETHNTGEVWIIAHRRELVEQVQQTLNRFCLAYGEKEEILKAKVRIRVLSIQWLTRHVKEFEGSEREPGLIVVDEAHHALASSYEDVFVRFKFALKLGMTATPCRLKKASFTKLFDKLLESPCTKDFIMRGYLSPYDYVVIGLFSTDQMKIDQLKGRGSDGDYAINEMDEALNIPEVIQRLFNSVKEYADGKKGIVYAIDIVHARAIAACYCALGIKAVALDSKTPAKVRNKMVEDFRNGDIDCLVNVNLFDEGFDCPDVEYIQMARPTLSLAKYLQMVGRGLRINKADPNKVCMIIDNVGNYRKFGYPDRPRRWTAMFSGIIAGKSLTGVSETKRMKNVIPVDEKLIMVKKAVPISKKMSAEEVANYWAQVKRCHIKVGSHEKWGLCHGDDIIMKPRLAHIWPFIGNYAAFEIGYSDPPKYGILDRRGNIIIPAQYEEITFKSDCFEVKKNGKTKIIPK